MHGRPLRGLPTEQRAWSGLGARRASPTTSPGKRRRRARAWSSTRPSRAAPDDATCVVLRTVLEQLCSVLVWCVAPVFHLPRLFPVCGSKAWCLASLYIVQPSQQIFNLDGFFFQPRERSTSRSPSELCVVCVSRSITRRSYNTTAPTESTKSRAGRLRRRATSKPTHDGAEAFKYDGSSPTPWESFVRAAFGYSLTAFGSGPGGSWRLIRLPVLGELSGAAPGAPRLSRNRIAIREFVDARATIGPLEEPRITRSKKPASTSIQAIPPV